MSNKVSKCSGWLMFVVGDIANASTASVTVSVKTNRLMYCHILTSHDVILWRHKVQLDNGYSRRVVGEYFLYKVFSKLTYGRGDWLSRLNISAGGRWQTILHNSRTRVCGWRVYHGSPTRGQWMSGHRYKDLCKVEFERPDGGDNLGCRIGR